MEHKPSAGRNALVIALIAAVILALLLCARQVPPPAGPLPSAPMASAQDPDATHPPVAAYLLVTVGEEESRLLPLTQPGRFTVTQGDQINIIEVTQDSVWMAESSCDNQDCVMQGKITLDNMNDRVLQNMIICLPHEVVLQLYSQAQLEALLEAGQEGGNAHE